MISSIFLSTVEKMRNKKQFTKLNARFSVHGVYLISAHYFS